MTIDLYLQQMNVKINDVCKSQRMHLENTQKPFHSYLKTKPQ